MNKITICFKKYVAFIIFYFALLSLSAQTTIYTENFNSGANGWASTSSGTNNSQWRFTTTNPETTASSGATGDYSYSRRHGSSKYRNSEYITNTKAISTAGYNNLTLSLSVWYKSETNYDGMNIEYSLNNGSSWNVLGAVGSSTNWYNTTQQATSNGFSTGTAEWSGNSGGWINASINLSAENIGFDDNTQVMFRVNLASDSSGRDTGVAFDNFKITGSLKASGPEINIKGLGNNITDGDLTPTTADATDFGNVVALNTTIHTFTIENLGNLNLDLTGASPYVTISGANAADFSVSSIPSTPIASSANTTFAISFSPNAVGLRTATISISNNDSNEDPYNFSISGNGVTTLSIGPGGVTTGLKLWLRADKGLGYTDGQGIALWSDQGLAGADATIHTAGQEPFFRDNGAKNVNFNPVIDFTENNPGSPPNTNYNLLPQQYLESSTGFYTQDIFVVALPNGTVTSTTGAMDTFTGDSNTSNDTEEDVTGIGYGNYSIRFTNELLSYAINTQAGYGQAQVSTTASYSHVGIVNATNNTFTSPTSEILYYNGNDVGNTEANASLFKNVSNSRYWIGRSQAYTASFYGRMSEIINFDTKLSAIDRNKVQSYLAIKYGITLLNVSGATTNYTSANGTPIWDATANAGFNYDVAGIGRDDAALLSQKQSKSVNTGAIVAIGLDTIAATNNLNTNTFADDGDYLIWGNNGAAINTFDSSKNIDLNTLTTTFTPVSRKWKIVETATSDVPEVLLSIPTATLASNIPLATGEEYSLVVSDDPSFGANNIIDVIPLTTNGANSEIFYDFDGTKYFTIAKATQKIAKRSVGFSAGQFLLGDKTLELSNSFTVSAWLKNNGSGGTFISKGSAYNFKINGANKIQVNWNGSTQLTANTALPVGKWHQIVLTFSGGTANLYIDGVLDKTVNSLPNPTPDNIQRFTIGALYTNKTTITSFDGAIDEVRIWSNPLPPTEIRYIMNQEIQSAGAYTSGVIIPSSITKDDINGHLWGDLKAYYDMNSYYGTSVEDRSNNKNWGRINYLTKDKKIVATQTAPLPYESTSSGSSWNTTTTWANNNVNDIPNTASIVNSAINIDWNIVETQNNIYANRDVKLLGLISNSDTLTVNTPHELNISHYLKLNGIIDLQGESQLVQTDGCDLDINSGGNLNRDQQGTSNSYKYNYWSSPVGNVSTTANNKQHSIADVLRDGTNPAKPIGINFLPAYAAADGGVTSPIILSTYWMYTFVDKPGGEYDAWTHIGDTGSLQAGQGFTMKGSNATTADQNYTFIGKPNNGDISLTISANNNYLVGNPYPSAIDANAFINDNLSIADGGNSTSPSSIDGTLYFWDHFGGGTHNLKSYEGGYGLLTKLTSTPAIANDARINNTGGISTLSPKRYIPVTQGFFVVADSTLVGSGTIVFKNSQRIFKTEASGLSQFLKIEGAAKSNTTASTTPIIRLQFNSPDGWHREIALGFDPKTTNHFDIGYDGKLIEDNPEDMYWIIDKDKYVIQGVKKFNTNRVLPLGIKISKAGNATIKLKSIENLSSNTKVYIKDKLTGKTTNINTSDYTINLEPGIYTKRFSLVFKSKTKHFEQDNSHNKQIIAYYNRFNKRLEFYNFSTKKIIKIRLLNFRGRTIKVWQKNLNKKHLSLSVPKLNGIYIIKIYTNKGLINKKIIIH